MTSDDVRPFFGEIPEVLGENTVGRRPDPQPRTGTWEERRQWYIAENCCPRPGCHRDLDDGACPGCGWTFADEKPVPVWTPESEDDYTVTLPTQLGLVEEYAPAEVDAA